jgi:hypothetical protein
MMSTHVATTRKRSPIVRLMRFISLGMIAIPIVAVFGAVCVVAAARSVPAYRSVNTGLLIEAVKNVGASELGESPHVAVEPPKGVLPLCADVDPILVKPFGSAFALMRGTNDGRRLYDVLVDNGVCVTVADLPFNAAYAESRLRGRDDWSSSTIVVDRSMVRVTDVDVLAAVLVHEATHIDRAVSGQACFLHDSCERLPNGVEIDEELAAHTAEAKWWIAAFGNNGKWLAIRTDYGENQLAKAYRRGPAAFREYVTNYRSDSREGEGISQ